MTRRLARLALAVPLVAMAPVAFAQNISGQGANWSGSWGFSSASDQSVKLNQAQVIRQAERGADPTTQYYTTNTYNTDNRSNYSQTDVTGDGPVTIDVVGGNKIGQQTYSVGSLNTGSTEITVMGDGNLIDANNSATTTGCVDGSISEMSFLWTPTDGSAGALLAEPTNTNSLWDMTSASIGGGCQ